MRPTPKWGGILLLVVVGFAGCASMRERPAESKMPSLYQRLGGREGIAVIVDEFVVNALADPRIGPAFKALPPAKVGPLKSNISDFICDATGGPCSYIGRTMKESHKGMNLAAADVEACNTALTKALDKRNVAVRDKEELMKIVGSQMKDIVGQ
jgi:hemoglobin